MLSNLFGKYELITQFAGTENKAFQIDKKYKYLYIHFENSTSGGSSGSYAVDYRLIPLFIPASYSFKITGDNNFVGNLVKVTVDGNYKITIQAGQTIKIYAIY